jgi:hypothetical protein|tara:strand:- start:1006 stop:1191 length:186 start_codon:yes stop_codon:yes gene_type:complete
MPKWHERKRVAVWRERGYSVQYHHRREQPYTVWNVDKVIYFTVTEREAIFYAERDWRRKNG